MTIKACVIGWPIGHSRSPLIHGHWLARHEIDGTYTKEAVKPDDLEAFLRGMSAGGFAGCNVTVPHKERALEFAEKADAVARTIGAANTLWIEDGVLKATNTDAYGFITHLDSSAPGWEDGSRPVAVLGAGGAARAVLAALLERGIAEVRLLNRTRARADNLAARFGAGVTAYDWHSRADALEDCGLMVNTTTLGMAGSAPLDIDLERLPTAAAVYDLVYAPLETLLLSQAARRGNRTIDGLGMLLHQAVPGFEKWFGVRPEVSDELRALIVADLTRT